jgi:hypothetical protein
MKTLIFFKANAKQYLTMALKMQLSFPSPKSLIIYVHGAHPIKLFWSEFTKSFSKLDHLRHQEQIFTSMKQCTQIKSKQMQKNVLWH